MAPMEGCLGWRVPGAGIPTVSPVGAASPLWAARDGGQSGNTSRLSAEAVRTPAANVPGAYRVQGIS